MNRNELKSILEHNVLLLWFLRRTPPVGVRRNMICTKSNFILNSFQGRINLNFRSPKHGSLNFNEARYNLIIVWDILVQDYRLIPCESVRIIETIPEKNFWKYYNDSIYPMTKQSKIKFMYS